MVPERGRLVRINERVEVRGEREEVLAVVRLLLGYGRLVRIGANVSVITPPL